MDGFPTTANSDKVNAPLLAIIMSEIWYTESISSIKSIIFIKSELKCL